MPRQRQTPQQASPSLAKSSPAAAAAYSAALPFPQGTEAAMGNQARQRFLATLPDVLASPGQGLDAVTRSFMEPRFGLDFSRPGEGV